mmetsp:Transcript_96207/g.267298  ORF Transcript_96207/g.267298 Transcript_96207/m.267298 type:complete len:230 (+) Transcript_96207:690-1379(+)
MRQVWSCWRAPRRHLRGIRGLAARELGSGAVVRGRDGGVALEEVSCLQSALGAGVGLQLHPVLVPRLPQADLLVLRLREAIIKGPALQPLPEWALQARVLHARVRVGVHRSARSRRSSLGGHGRSSRYTAGGSVRCRWPRRCATPRRWQRISCTRHPHGSLAGRQRWRDPRVAGHSSCRNVVSAICRDCRKSLGMGRSFVLCMPVLARSRAVESLARQSRSKSHPARIL